MGKYRLCKCCDCDDDDCVIETIVAKEREACAEIADRFDSATARRIASSIRVRGLKDKKHPNGNPMFAPDGTMLDEHGNRSIFDDVDL